MLPRGTGVSSGNFQRVSVSVQIVPRRTLSVLRGCSDSMGSVAEEEKEQHFYVDISL